MPYGWLLIGCIMVVLSFPPLAGYNTCTSLCGFAWGLQGFLVAAPATQIGSALAFLVLRNFFKHRISSWTTKNKNWKALEEVIQAEGLPLIILIRLSPFPPYVYSQALFASVSVVKFWQFMLATVFYQSRILLSVFVGSRVAVFSDEKQRGQMDASAKVINGASIVIGLSLSIGVGWFLYRTTQKKILEMEGEEGDFALEGLEGVENIPLLFGSASEDVLPENSRRS